MPKPGGQLLVCCLTHIPSIKGSNDEINKKFNCNDGGLNDRMGILNCYLRIWSYFILCIPMCFSF